MITKMLISAIFLVAGCGGDKQSGNATSKPGKELRLEEKVAGTYSYKDDNGDSYRAIFLENGVFEAYKEGKKDKKEGRWKKVDKEVHVTNNAGVVGVFRINSDNSLAFIGGIKNGERTDLTDEEQFTYKIIR